MPMVGPDSEMFHNDVQFRCLLAEQLLQAISHGTDPHPTTPARYPDEVVLDEDHRPVIVSIGVSQRHIIAHNRLSVTRGANSSPRLKPGAFLACVTKGFR